MTKTHPPKRVPMCPICDAPMENSWHQHVVKTAIDHFADTIKDIHRLGLDATVVATGNQAAQERAVELGAKRKSNRLNTLPSLPRAGHPVTKKA